MSTTSPIPLPHPEPQPQPQFATAYAQVQTHSPPFTSPRLDPRHLAFLPHAPTSPASSSSSPPPSSYISRPPGSSGALHHFQTQSSDAGNPHQSQAQAHAQPPLRQRARPQPPSPRVRSAPTSPLGRARAPQGITPLSVISPIRLGEALPPVPLSLGEDARMQDGSVRGRGLGGPGGSVPVSVPMGVGVAPNGAGGVSSTTVQAKAVASQPAPPNGNGATAFAPMTNLAAFQRPTAAASLPLPGAAKASMIPVQSGQAGRRTDDRVQNVANDNSVAAAGPSRPYPPSQISQSQQTQTTYYPQQPRIVSGPQLFRPASGPVAPQHLHSQQTGTLSITQRMPSQPIRQQFSTDPRFVSIPGVGQTSSGRPKMRLLRSRSRSRPTRMSGSGTSGSETETGMDSDTTLMPGRRGRGPLSQSQPDLVTLRSRLEGWAGDVAREQGNAHGRGDSQAPLRGRRADETVSSFTPRQSGVTGGQGAGWPPQWTANSGEAGKDNASQATITARSARRRSSGGETPPSSLSPVPPSPGRADSAPVGSLPSPGKSPKSFSRSFSHLSSLRLSPVNSNVNLHMSTLTRPPAPVGTAPPSPGARADFDRFGTGGAAGTRTPGSPGSPFPSAFSDDSLGSVRPIPVGQGYGAGLGLGGTYSSEDADDSLDSSADTSSPSSGSLSFAPRRRELRRRLPSRNAERDREGLDAQTGLSQQISSLGLSFADDSAGIALSGAATDGTGPVEVGSWTSLRSLEESVRRLRESGMFLLRLLAVVPAVWGWSVLMHAAMTGRLRTDVYPWGVDTSREALDGLISGRVVEGVWERVERGDMLLASAWAILTGHFCFEMTTGLTHRWRVYYDPAATLTRLLSIQCICWPLTGLTLWVLGHERARTLFAWVVIGVTTAASRSVQMYVTSNIPGAKRGRRDGESRSIGSGAGERNRSGGSGDDTPKRGTMGLGLGPSAVNGLGGGSGGGGSDGEEVGEEGMGWWAKFRLGRHWEWDAVAREVGWKVGVLLLLTCAWLFWGVESGRWSVGVGVEGTVTR